MATLLRCPRLRREGGLSTKGVQVALILLKGYLE